MGDLRRVMMSFRRQLNEELKRNPTIVPMGLVSWMHFRGTGMCQIEGEE